MNDDVLSHVEASPIENLPVAAGKRRRGRPRKTPAVVASSDAAGGSLASDVKEVIQDALAKKKEPGALTRKGVVGLVKQLIRKNASGVVNKELRADDSQVIGLSDQASIRSELKREAREEIQANHAPRTGLHSLLLRLR